MLSLLFMLIIGLKGGMVLYGSLYWKLLFEMGVVMFFGVGIFFFIYFILNKLFGLLVVNSLSIVVYYGLVSVGIFVVVLVYVELNVLDVGVEVILYLVMLELLVIIVGLLLFCSFGNSLSKYLLFKVLWYEILINKSVILLVGGVIIGMMYGI